MVFSVLDEKVPDNLVNLCAAIFRVTLRVLVLDPEFGLLIPLTFHWSLSPMGPAPSCYWQGRETGAGGES